MMPHGTPAFRWEWNLNTVVVLVGFAGGLIAWGFTLSQITDGLTAAGRNIDALATQVSAVSTRVDGIEKTVFKLDLIDNRVTVLEKGADNTDSRAQRLSESYASQSADTGAKLATLSIQVALMNQSLQRLEATASTPPPTKRN